MLGKVKELDHQLHLVSDLSASTAARTSPVGCSALKHDVETLIKEKEETESELQNVEEQLRLIAKSWKEFENTHSVLQQSMDSVEIRLKEIVPAGTLKEKEDQLTRIKALCIIEFLIFNTIFNWAIGFQWPSFGGLL